MAVENHRGLGYTRGSWEASIAMSPDRTAALGTASMPKALCIFATAISVLLLAVFGLDLATSIPFGRSLMTDIGFLIAAGILGYLSWSALREQR